MRLACSVVLLAVAALLASSESSANGDTRNRVNWMLQCQGCHRVDGSATGAEVPALAGRVSRFLRVPGGREFLIRVPGVASAPLADAELTALVNWMLVEFDPEHLPALFEPYGEEEIRNLRARPFGGPSVSVERARLMAAIEALDRNK